MRSDIVSVIVPIYNVEEFLDRCIRSIVSQTYKNLEIILVDDGSFDHSPNICEKWAVRDNRIKVIHKKNAGAGMARNTGMDNATGEYICFVDSDDYIALDTVEKAYYLAKEKDADVVSYGYCYVGKSGTVMKDHVPTPKKMYYEGKDILGYVLPNMIAPDTANGETTNLGAGMCHSLFSAELLRRANWRMVSERNIISEDMYSTLCLYKYVKKVAIIPENLYFYCENMKSFTHMYMENRFERIKDCYDACIEACNKFGYSDEIKERLKYPYLSNTIAALKTIVVSNLNNEEKKDAFKAVIEDAHLQDTLKKMNIRKESLSRKAFVIALRMKSYVFCNFMIRAKVRNIGRRRNASIDNTTVSISDYTGL